MINFIKLLFCGKLGILCKWTNAHKLEKFHVLDVEFAFPFEYYQTGKQCIRCGKVLWDDGQWSNIVFENEPRKKLENF